MSIFHTFPTLTSTILHGKKLGRTLRFPTLNCTGQVAMSSWTYKVRIKIDNQFFSWMGVYFSQEQRCEVHAFQMQWEHRYWKEITVTFLHKIRENKKFETVNLLQQQLQKDKEWCHSNLWNVFTFGSFDLIHPGHLAYLTHAKQQGDFLTTIVASDESIRQFKQHEPQYSQSKRIHHLQDTWLVDTIIAWHPQNFYSTLQDTLPRVLVFGYDQHLQWVASRYHRQSLPLPFFIQANAYHPEVFKSSKLKKGTK
jgi:cytidyltransferase-like protein